MTSYKRQALIEAPATEVWQLLEDVSTYPEWADAVDVTGVPTEIEKGSSFEMKNRGPLGIKPTTTCTRSSSAAR